MIRADRVPPKERSVQNAEMRCEDEASASYIRVDCPTHLHGTLLHLPVLELLCFSVGLMGTDSARSYYLLRGDKLLAGDVYGSWCYTKSTS